MKTVVGLAIFLASCCNMLVSCKPHASDQGSVNSTPVIAQEIVMSSTPTVAQPNIPPMPKRFEVLAVKPEHLAYLTKAFRAAIQTMAGKVELDKMELFGKGEEEAAKSFDERHWLYSKEVAGYKFDFRFKARIRGTDLVWQQMSFSFEPDQANAVYKMDLPPSFFDGLALQKAQTEKHSSPLINEFEFRTTNTPTPLSVTFIAAAELTSLEDKYPKSFHSVRIRR